MFTQKTVEHAKEFLKDSNFEFLKLVSESNGNKKAISYNQFYFRRKR